MGKSKTKQAKQKAIARVDSALTILNKIQDKSREVYDALQNPFDYLMYLFKSIVGYDKFLKIVSKLIVLEIPVIEYGVKTLLSTHIKNILSCNFNPMISDRMLQDGFVFDLRGIDLKGILNYCPIGKGKKEFGKYYYFGCDDFDITDELICSRDFDAVLWYAKNRANGRRVPWLGYKRQGNAQNKVEYNQQQKKEDGIVTLEYSENGLDTQVPSKDAIRMFIGNTCRITSDSGQTIYDNQVVLHDAERNINKYDTLLSIIDGYISQLNEISQNPVVYGNSMIAFNDLNMLNEFRDSVANGSAPLIDIYNSSPLWRQCITLPDMNYYISSLNETISIEDVLWQHTRKTEVKRKTNAQQNIDAAAEDTGYYRSVDLNYYHNRSVLEFNLDYIWSIKLFDAKVLTAQLIDALTGCVSIDLGLSITQQVIKDEVDKMVNSIVETDDAIVDDCFFRFSNDEYQAMYNAAEMRRMGLPAGAGVSTQPAYVDAESLLSSLNEIDSSADDDVILRVVENCISNASVEMSKSAEKYPVEIGFSANANFLDNLLSNLANVIVSSLISPKLYMLIAINKQMLGENDDFDVAGFIEANKNMLVDIIRSIRDIILDYLKNELMKVLNNIVKQIAQKISLEQFEYYRRLLMQCIAAFGRLKNNTAWNMADVNYADILQDKTTVTPAESNC